MEVLSINPYWYKKDRDLGGEDRRKIQNDKLAELVGAHPDRFAAFASLTLQDPDAGGTAARDGDEETGNEGSGDR